MPSNDERIPITIVGNRGLIFDLNQVKKLRSLGISGVLGGTLPTAPQQNVFLGLPLQLIVEEIIWLIENGHAYLVLNELAIKNLIDSLSDHDIKYINDLNNQETEAEKLYKQKINEELILKLKLSPEQEKKKLLELNNTENKFIKISDNSINYPNYGNFLKFFKDSNQQISIISKFVSTNKNYSELSYKLFRFFKNKGYFLAPGLRFGGKFIAYPGDSLRYHAHLIINSYEYYSQDIGLLNLVTCGRLATGVKKIWLIGGERKQLQNEADSDEVKLEEADYIEKLKSDDSDKEIVCFSIEWAGFG